MSAAWMLPSSPHGWVYGVLRLTLPDTSLSKLRIAARIKRISQLKYWLLQFNCRVPDLMKLSKILFITSLLCSVASFAAEKPLLRIGVLAFGTTNWELLALEQQKLLDNADFKLDVHKVANPQAGKIALQADAVDMIITDWIWVNRMRASGSDYSFYPYSSASGALVVAKDSNIHSIADLKDKRLGIGGDELDKNWLLLQALAQQQNLDLNQNVQKSFGAPPLLNQQLLQQNVDAVLNYWHYAAELEAKGYQILLSGQDILKGLGINSAMPNLGYVFKQSWAEQHKAALTSFIKVTEHARDQLCSSDAAWQPIIPLLKTDDATTQNKLRQRYCEGRVTDWNKTQAQTADKIYALLRTVSGSKLTGETNAIQAGTFWFTE